jgi:hypothetical protein
VEGGKRVGLGGRKLGIRCWNQTWIAYICVSRVHDDAIWGILNAFSGTIK